MAASPQAILILPSLSLASSCARPTHHPAAKLSCPTHQPSGSCALCEFAVPDFALSLAELSCNGLDAFVQSHRLIAAQS